MKKKLAIIIILVVILGGGVIAINLFTKEEKNINNNVITNTFYETEDIQNEILNNVGNEEKIDENVENDIIQNNVYNSVVRNQKKEDTKEKIDNKSTENKNVSNISKKEEGIKVIANNNTTTKKEDKNNNVKSNDIKKEETEAETDNKEVSDNKEETKEDVKEETTNSSLANTTYRKINTSILPEIKNILEDEISKDKELVDFGTTVVTTNKSNAYANAKGFTYLFVKEIEKGKVEGNYVKFPERIRNVVGAFGKYYIYAEDEFVYNSQGTNPKWCQTLIWIYVRFE